MLVTDSLEQYHLLDKKLPGVTNANCWAHARRAFADAVKAADKKDPLCIKIPWHTRHYKRSQNSADGSRTERTSGNGSPYTAADKDKAAG